MDATASRAPGAGQELLAPLAILVCEDPEA
jgi:hypothetical protein